MCVTAIIAGAALVASAVGTYSSIKANNAQTKFAKYQAAEQTRLLKADTELQKIASYDRENMRAREFNRTWSSSLAAIGATGAAEHISFFQGAGPEGERQLAQDVRALRLGLTQDVERTNSQIGVVGYGAKVAAFNGRMNNIGSVAGFVQDAMSAASFYMNNGTPKAKPAGG